MHGLMREGSPQAVLYSTHFFDPIFSDNERPDPIFSRAKPSTLQDVLAGKTLEIDALLGQTQAFAREECIATPVIDVCVPLLRGLDASLRAK